MRKIALIGGSGVQESMGATGFTSRVIGTPFGEAKCEIGSIAGNQVVFLARHGLNHVLPPHKINYRANMWALKHLGTEEILATTAVGSVNTAIQPGEFVVCDQFLDFTKNRVNTFFNGEQGLVAHVDFTEPYCPRLRHTMIKILTELRVNFHSTGCYVCTEGPRYESKAEVKMFGSLGGDVVGMTNIPEVLLAREAEMCYTNVSLVTNLGAGLSAVPLAHEDVLEAMSKMQKQIVEIFAAFIKNTPDKEEAACSCAKALSAYGGFPTNSYAIKV